MVDVARDRWPQDMRRAVHDPSLEIGPIEMAADTVVHSVQDFIHERPETAVLCALGIGFMLGWSLRIW